MVVHLCQHERVLKLLDVFFDFTILLGPQGVGRICQLQHINSEIYYEHISISACLLVQIIEGFGVSRVLHSKHQNFKAGDVLTGLTGWEEYSVIHNTAQLRKIQQDDDDDDESVPIPLSYHVGLLGKYLFVWSYNLWFHLHASNCIRPHVLYDLSALL